MEKLVTKITVKLCTYLLDAIVVMVGWNAVVPNIFRLEQISYFQAFILVLVCDALFKGK